MNGRSLALLGGFALLAAAAGCGEDVDAAPTAAAPTPADTALLGTIQRLLCT